MLISVATGFFVTCLIAETSLRVIDGTISASTTTNGMTARMNRANDGRRLPGPWLVDNRGEASDDPRVMLTDPPGAILPLALVGLVVLAPLAQLGAWSLQSINEGLLAPEFATAARNSSNAAHSTKPA